MSKPVLVVGAGPVGLTMAAELARYRIPVRIIDKAPARSDKSKALAVWPRTLELLASAGCADAFVAAGLKAGAIDIHSGNTIVARLTVDHIDSPFRYLLILPQSETERLLETHLETLGGKVMRGTELTGFTETADGVSCTVRHPDGQDGTIDAGWLIGCDGAHSLVRRTLGMTFAGDTLPTGFMIADVHIAGLTIPPADLAIFWHEDGPLMLFPISPGHYRVIADTGSATNPHPAFEDVQAIVAQRGPGGVTLSDPVWLSGFAVNERKVENYRAGRVFLAGDAAHVHSPAGGQGMNTGMQDAFNLAWKLALVEKGLADSGLPDSYSPERSAVARQVLTDSGRLTRVMLVRNRLTRLLRRLAAHRILSIPAVQHAVADRLAGLTIGYPDSPLSTGSARTLSGPRPGQRFIADSPFSTGNTPRFALAATENADARAMTERYSPLLETEIRKPPDEKGIWLIRPDGYVAATAHAEDWSVIDAALSAIVTSATSTRIPVSA